MAESTSAEDIIARLGLEPHPEGGHFRETFRDARLDGDGRAQSTAISSTSFSRAASARTGTVSMR